MGRAAERGRIGEEAKRMGKPWDSIECVDDAVDAAISYAGKEDIVLVTGSVFAVGEARRRWINSNRF
jgi:folylpolyglutamate synthase/dihydropteroate synthase